MTSGLELGNRVRFTHQLKRRATSRRDHIQPGDERKYWAAEHAPFGRFGGIIVGRRTLADGYNTWDYDAGSQFTAEKRFRAYMVAWHLDKRPVLCLPEHLEPVGTPEPPAPPDDDELCRRARWCRRALADPALEAFQ